jgi:hypothetical protein
MQHLQNTLKLIQMNNCPNGWCHHGSPPKRKSCQTKARIRELDEIAAEAAHIKDEEERKRNATKGKGYVTDHEWGIQDDLYWASRKRGELAHIHNQQRQQNSRISATWCASTFITASVVVPSTATQLEFSPHVVDAGQEKRASMQRTAFGRGEHACTNPAPVALLMHV